MQISGTAATTLPAVVVVVVAVVEDDDDDDDDDVVVAVVLASPQLSQGNFIEAYSNLKYLIIPKTAPPPGPLPFVKVCIHCSSRVHPDVLCALSWFTPHPHPLPPSPHQPSHTAEGAVGPFKPCPVPASKAVMGAQAKGKSLQSATDFDAIIHQTLPPDCPADLCPGQRPWARQVEDR